MATENTKIERRYFHALDVRMIASDNPDKRPMMKGMAALFNNVSADLGGFKEQIAPGAFTNCLRGCDVRALWNHNADHVLGRTAAGTLRLKETDQGLLMECDMPDTTMGRDLQVSMDRGDIDQMSFGFTVAKDSWDEVNGECIRTLLEIDTLYDVSPVTFPAYPDTSVAVRSMDLWKKEANGAEADPTALISTMRKRLDLKAKLMEV